MSFNKISETKIWRKSKIMFHREWQLYSLHKNGKHLHRLQKILKQDLILQIMN